MADYDSLHQDLHATNPTYYISGRPYSRLVRHGLSSVAVACTVPPYGAASHPSPPLPGRPDDPPTRSCRRVLPGCCSHCWWYDRNVDSVVPPRSRSLDLVRDVATAGPPSVEPPRTAGVLGPSWNTQCGGVEPTARAATQVQAPAAAGRPECIGTRWSFYHEHIDWCPTRGPCERQRQCLWRR